MPLTIETPNGIRLAPLSFRCQSCETRFSIKAQSRRMKPRCPKCGRGSAEDKCSVLKRACDFLIAQLSEGPKPSAVLLSGARHMHISNETLRRAAREIGVNSYRRNSGKRGQGQWQWALVQDGQHKRHDHLERRRRLLRMLKAEPEKVRMMLTASEKRRYEEILKERPRNARGKREYQITAIEAVLMEDEKDEDQK